MPSYTFSLHFSTVAEHHPRKMFFLPREAVQNIAVSCKIMKTYHMKVPKNREGRGDPKISRCPRCCWRCRSQVFYLWKNCRTRSTLVSKTFDDDDDDIAAGLTPYKEICQDEIKTSSSSFQDSIERGHTQNQRSHIAAPLRTNALTRH